MEKLITLKNNLIVKLVQEDGFCSCKLNAYDEQGNRVGKCDVTIKKTYSRPLTEQQKQTYCKVHKVDYYGVPEERDITVSCCDNNIYKIEGNTLTFLGKEYKFKNAFCLIDEIKILDERFYKVGLGYNLLKQVEEIARLNNCSHIEGFFYPNGPFQFGSQEFYKRNGFLFEKRYGNMTYISKQTPLHEKNALVPIK